VPRLVTQLPDARVRLLPDPADVLGDLGQTASVAITTKSSAADALYVPTAAITNNATARVLVINMWSGS